ncbi:probable L-type lectin-domain containing receptor kinase S.5 [Humulus lupulus]|uniref:probable L-type lectin-domain containing receptor kinase S.5 n=1 Tax=Humulus lupulus TaxID=3486 RepID=UPI002B4184D1|nr:probable L-type lectin-domain containing receptor kinase S.5 [Humulus lupulus]
MNKKLLIFMVLCFALLQNPTTISSAKLKPKTKGFIYDTFDEGKDSSSFIFNSSSIDLKALQLTPDNENQPNGYNNKSGRIMYHKRYKLWSTESQNDDVIASFNTNFVINMYRNDNWEAGEGLTFLIAPDLVLPDQSYGRWLGLTNATTDGKPGNHFVAIEFDTKSQGSDPIGSHIGLDVNSVVSNKTVLVDQFKPKANYSVWIEYDGVLKLMEVYMAIDGDAKPEKPILSDKINLKDYVNQYSYFGFSGSTGDPAKQFNCVIRWKLEIDDLNPKKHWKPLIIGVSVSLPLLGLASVLLCIKIRRAKKRGLQDEESNVLGTLKRLPGMPREFKFKDLKRATKNFHESMILGKGGFGVVYRGVLNEENDHNGNSNSSASSNEVAVKKFSRDNIDGKEDFLAELTIIHRLRHKHLVRLEGWCYEKGKLLLVYDYMPNGSVEKHLNKSSNQNTLSWEHRHKILTGVASALHYLHNEYDQKVVHRDLKASNILLDSNYNARLGDFGLARALENERNSYAELELCGVPGTMGYVAPECFHTGKASPESDVFGFGAVALEVVTGRSPGVQIQHEKDQLTLVDWVWMLHREGRIEEAVDERLSDEYDVEEANRLLLLGLACSHPVASMRPQTQVICQIISETMPPPHVPPFKPVFTWPSLSTTAFSSNESSFSNFLSNSSKKHGLVSH